MNQITLIPALIAEDKFPGSWIEAPLDDKLDLPCVGWVEELDFALPKRAVCRQPLESGRDLADDIEEEVFIIAAAIKGNIIWIAQCFLLIHGGPYSLIGIVNVAVIVIIQRCHL